MILSLLLMLASPPPDSLRARLQRTLDSIVAAQGLPGATAALSIDGKVIAIASGFADRERGTRMRSSSRMLVGSAAKPFFAAVALQLAAEGKLDLDAPVSKWLGSEPWFARLTNAGQITMRHLLSHRSGIANHAGDSTFAALVRNATQQQRDLGFTPLQQIQLVLDRPAPFAVGDGFLYSDTGYLIAAMVLERVTGKTYFQELQRRVLRPLHLKATEPSDHPTLKGIAQGNGAPAGSVAATKGFALWGLPPRMVQGGKLVLNPVYEWTGGGLISNSSDLARWMETLFEGQPWKSFGDSMTIRRPAGAPYGLGIFIAPGDNGDIYMHPGGFPGYASYVAYSPTLGVGIAFQTNQDGANMGAAVRALLSVLGRSRGYS